MPEEKQHRFPAPPTVEEIFARTEGLKRRLAKKEAAVVHGVLSGKKNKEIAEELGTTEQVIKNYLRTVYDKTGVSDRLELALFYMGPDAPRKTPEPERKTQPELRVEVTPPTPKTEIQKQWCVAVGEFAQRQRDYHADGYPDIANKIRETRLYRGHTRKDLDSNLRVPDSLLKGETWERIEKGDPTLELSVFRNAIREMCVVYDIERPSPQGCIAYRLLHDPAVAG